MMLFKEAKKSLTIFAMFSIMFAPPFILCREKPGTARSTARKAFHAGALAPKGLFYFSLTRTRGIFKNQNNKLMTEFDYSSSGKSVSPPNSFMTELMILLMKVKNGTI